MIDWHSHILPGIDDGASSIEESLAMARLLVQAGFTHVCCTPHRLRGMFDTEPAAMRQALATLQQVFDRENLQLTLVAGMEYCLDEFFIEDFSADPVPVGQSRYVLVETPAHAEPQLLRENIFHLVRNSYTPLFAHPERHAFLAPPPKASGSFFHRVSAWMNKEPDREVSLEDSLLGELRGMGCLFQGNLGSVGGYYGSLVRAQEQRLRQAGFFSCYGSDAHTLKSLEQFLLPALDELGGDASLFSSRCVI